MNAGEETVTEEVSSSCRRGKWGGAKLSHLEIILKPFFTRRRTEISLFPNIKPLNKMGRLISVVT